MPKTLKERRGGIKVHIAVDVNTKEGNQNKAIDALLQEYWI